MSWTFLAYDTSKSMSMSGDEIRKGLKHFHSPIPYNPDETRHLNQVLDFVSSSRKMAINIKVFYSFFCYDQTFPNLRVMGSNNHCIYSNFERGIHSLGLKISQVTKGLSQEGADAVLAQPTYNWRYGYKNAVDDECLVLRFKANGISLAQMGEASENEKKEEDGGEK